MTQLTRRDLLVKAGVAAAGGAVGSAIAADSASANAGDNLIGYVHDEGGQVYNVKAAAWGAQGDTVIVSGAGSISSGTTTLTWSGGHFVSGSGGDGGKTVTVQGAGASGAVLVAKIVTVNSATSVTLDTAASTTVSGAEFSYGTDDTTKIQNTINALVSAGANGVVFVPPGIYTITSQLQINPGSTSYQIGLVGAGGRCVPNVSAAATVFLCANAGAGLLVNGWGSSRGFLCHGNNIATAPLVNGVLTGGIATNGCSYCTFADVWSTASAGNGWGIFGCQNNSYWDCGTTNNAGDGLYIDGGAGGEEFWRFHESGSRQYGVHGDIHDDAAGGYLTFTGNVHFFGGELISDGTTSRGVSKIYNRGGQDWKFLDMVIRGDNLSGPTVDLGQGAAFGSYGLDFSGCFISATPTGNNPGLACIQISEGPFLNAKYLFAKMDRIRFLAGDTSVYIAAANGYYRYSGIGWIFDNTTHGPVGASNINGIDTLLEGRTGAWQSASLAASWSGTVKYRIRSDGQIELKGSAVWSSGAAATIFTLPTGYRPTSGSPRITAVRSDGVKYVTVDTGGNVGTTTTGGALTVYLDGVCFPTS